MCCQSPTVDICDNFDRKHELDIFTRRLESTPDDEDFETNKGETEDLYDKLMEMSGWNVTETENESQ